MKWKPLAPRPSRLVSALSEPNSPNITKHEIGPPLFDEEQRLWLASLLRKAKSRATSAEIAQFVEAVAASVVQWHLASTMPPAATARQVHNALRQFWILASEPEPAIGLIKARLRALPSEAVSAMEVRGRLLWPSIFKAKLPPCGLIGWSKTAAPADLVQGLRLITANGAAAVAGRSRLNGRQSRPSLGSGLIDPEDDDGGQGDGGHEGMGASVIAGVDAAPIFEAAEHVLDPVALPVECRVVRYRDLSVLA